MTDSTFKLIPTRLQFLGVLSVCLLFSPLIADEDGWKEVKSKNGITVYEKEVDGRTAFRGTCEMIGSPEKLVGILHNPDRWNEWIENLEEGSLVEKKSDFHLIFRQVIDAPFPTTNRELVFESIVSRSGASGIKVEMKSINHPKVIRSKLVRAHIFYSRYLIDSLEGNRIRVIFENLSDPEGKIPRFIVDWASKSYPITLLEGIRREMALGIQKKAPLPE